MPWGHSSGRLRLGDPLMDFSAVTAAAPIGLQPFFTDFTGSIARFDVTSILVMAPIAVAAMMEHYRRHVRHLRNRGENFLERPGLHRTLIGDGIATSLAGLFGGPANTTYGENTGVLVLSRVYDPKVVRLAAVYAVVLSFSPAFAALVNSIPTAIIGGVSFILYGMISAIGVRNVVENRVDFTNSRNLIIAAVILVCGLGFSGGITFPVGGPCDPDQSGHRRYRGYRPQRYPAGQGLRVRLRCHRGPFRRLRPLLITRAAASAAALFAPSGLILFSNLMFETMSVSRYNGDTPRGLEVFAMKENAMNPHRLAVLAMMTAVVFAVNFPRIIIPLPTGETSFTLANIACVLSGMLLGPLGGLASGLGSALYDLTNPIFAPECWLTFLTKGRDGLGGWAGVPHSGTARRPPTAAVWPPHWLAA